TSLPGPVAGNHRPCRKEKPDAHRSRPHPPLRHDRPPPRRRLDDARGRPIITHCPGCGEWLGSPFVAADEITLGRGSP
ncbi:MAG: hypothetical protein M3P53_13210, partial [Actinomycetota bacterium]|nr:hypothetical protein [Actinomycetota bacterium]